MVTEVVGDKVELKDPLLSDEMDETVVDVKRALDLAGKEEEARKLEDAVASARAKRSAKLRTAGHSAWGTSGTTTCTPLPPDSIGQLVSPMSARCVFRSCAAGTQSPVRLPFRTRSKTGLNCLAARAVLHLCVG